MVISIFPILGTARSLIKAHNVDFISGITLMGIVVSLIATAIGGSPKLMLIRESFMTLGLGIACMVSFLFPRPLMFYFGCQFNCGNDPEKQRELDGRWKYPGMRAACNMLTLVWGIVYLSEFAAKVVMVNSLSIERVLVVGPIVNNVVTLSTVAWTFACVGRLKARYTKPSLAVDAGGPSQPSESLLPGAV